MLHNEKSSDESSYDDRIVIAGARYMYCRRIEKWLIWAILRARLYNATVVYQT